MFQITSVFTEEAVGISCLAVGSRGRNIDEDDLLERDGVVDGAKHVGGLTSQVPMLEPVAPSLDLPMASCQMAKGCLAAGPRVN